jgi:hypothetical protein
MTKKEICLAFATAAEGIQHNIENLAHEAGFDDVQSKVLALHSEKSWNEELFQFR